MHSLGTANSSLAGSQDRKEEAEKEPGINGWIIVGEIKKQLMNWLDKKGDAQLGGIVLDGGKPPKAKAEAEKVEKDGTSQTGMMKRECTAHCGKIVQKKKNFAQSGEEAGLPIML